MWTRPCQFPLTFRDPWLTLKKLELKPCGELRPMTISAGFRCQNGVLLCADSEITTLSGGKKYEVKLFHINWREECYLAYAGSTLLARELVEALRSFTKDKRGRDLLETVKTAYQEFHRKHYTQAPRAEKAFTEV